MEESPILKRRGPVRKVIEDSDQEDKENSSFTPVPGQRASFMPKSNKSHCEIRASIGVLLDEDINSIEPGFQRLSVKREEDKYEESFKADYKKDVDKKKEVEQMKDLSLNVKPKMIQLSLKDMLQKKEKHVPVVDVNNDLANSFKNISLVEMKVPEMSQKEKMIEYNSLVRQAKGCESSNEMMKAYQLYLSASMLFPDRTDLERKLSKLKALVSTISVDESDLVSLDQWFYKHPKNSAQVVMKGGFILTTSLYEKLYPYQRLCLSWLWGLHSVADSGCILADDMGLGKTLQISAFLRGLFNGALAKCVLLISPLSVMDNWQQHLKDTGNKVYLYHGTARQRSDAINDLKKNGGVLLTSYGMITKSAKVFIEIFDTVNFKRWDYVILDEGHRIKNPSIQLSQQVRLIPSKHRVIVTGTPVQNSLEDLWSLFDYVTVGKLLGDHRAFKEEFSNPIMQSQDKKATERERQYGNRMSKVLQDLIQPYFLRRTKAQIISSINNVSVNECLFEFGKESKEILPEDDDFESKPIKIAPVVQSGIVSLSKIQKNDFIVWCMLTSDQLSLYRNFTDSESVKELLNTTKSPLAALTVLKKICDSVQLINSNMKLCGDLQYGWDETLSNASQSQLNKFSEFDIQRLFAGSQKLEILVSLLENHRSNGHRTLIFSQSKKMLNIIAGCLRARSFKFLRIDGEVTKPEERQRLINVFNSDSSYNAFLLTTQTGGLGVTLTGADRVIIYDPHWNPSGDSQAVDRAYRIGQNRPVVVYRLITCGTIEEKIYRKQVFKSSLFQATVSQDRGAVTRYFTKSELREVFKLEDPYRSETQVQLRIQHQGQRKTYQELDQHLLWLESLKGIFGVSDHDLLFSKLEMIDISEDVHAQAESIKQRMMHTNIKQRPAKNMLSSPGVPNVSNRIPINGSPDVQRSEGKKNVISDSINDSPLVLKSSIKSKRVILSPESPAPSNAISSYQNVSSNVNFVESSVASTAAISSSHNQVQDVPDNFDIYDKSDSKEIIISQEEERALDPNDLEPGARPCCDIHYSSVLQKFEGIFECSKCSCYLTLQEKIQFNELKKLALLAMSTNGMEAFDLAAEALSICDDDLELQEFVYSFGVAHKNELRARADEEHIEYSETDESSDSEMNSYEF